MSGETVTEADATGRKLKTYVKAAGETLARQTVYHNTTNNFRAINPPDLN